MMSVISMSGMVDRRVNYIVLFIDCYIFGLFSVLV